MINQNFINQSPYLRTSRQFPIDPGNLCIELNTMYNEVSNAINLRTIGLFPTTRGAITGEGWYLNSPNRQQGIRQVYTLAGPISTDTDIPHFIPVNSYTNFVRIWGTCFETSAQVWNTLPRMSVTNVTSQIRLQVNATNIRVEFGVTAPAIQNIMICLEYLSNV